MSSVWCTVLVDSVVCITVVSDDDSLIIVSLGSLDNVLYTVVNSVNSLSDSVVDTCVTYHITISEVYNDEVVLLSVDSTNQLILYLVSAHLWLQVVCSYLWRRNQDTVLALVWSLTTTIEEECYVSILLCLCSVELLLALCAQVLAESIHYVLLREEDVNALEACIVWSHAVVLQVLDGVHAFLWHILLSQYLCQLLGTVVTVVDEDNNITLLNSTVNLRVIDWLDELVCYVLIIAFLHCLHHIVSLLTLTLNEQVVCFLHTVPALVTVHSIETTYDACDVCTVLVAASLHLLDEALTALRVCITAIHEAVNVCLLQTIFLTNLNQLEEVIQRRMNTTGRSQAHQVEFLTSLLSIAVSVDDLLILQDVTALASLVDLNEVLIYHTTSTDVEVTYLRVTHLTVRKTYVLATSLESRMCRNCCQIIEIRSWSLEDNITLIMLTDSPSVENH